MTKNWTKKCTMTIPRWTIISLVLILNRSSSIRHTSRTHQWMFLKAQNDRIHVHTHALYLSIFPSLSLSLNDQDFRFAACLLVHVEKVLVNTLEIELKPAGEKSAPRCERCSVIENKTIMECRTITQLISLDLGCLIGASRVCKPCEPRFFFLDP